MKVPLKPSTALPCCTLMLKLYIRIQGRPNEWLPPGQHIALYDPECNSRLTFTHEEGWQREEC